MNYELALCAKINFENLEKVMPLIKAHPYYMIAKAQLDESLGDDRAFDKITKQVSGEHVGST